MATTRDKVIQKTRDLLIGPLEADEILYDVPPESGPADFYLTGILWPPYSNLKAEEDEKIETADEEGGEVGAGDDSVSPLYSMFRPSSIGITFTLAGEDTRFSIIIRAARYFPLPSAGEDPEVAESEGDEVVSGADPSGTAMPDANADGDGGEGKSGKKRNRREPRDWQRIPIDYRVEVAGNETRPFWTENTFILPDGSLAEDSEITLHLVRRKRSGLLIVTATLMNTCSNLVIGESDSSCLFQSQIEAHAVSADDEEPLIIARPADFAGEDRISGLLYREMKEFAVGHGISATWPDTSVHRVPWVKTEWIPSQKVHSVSPKGHESLGKLSETGRRVFSAGFLAEEGNRSATVAGLSEFCGTYLRWIADERIRSAVLEEPYRQTAADNLSVCEDACKRMEKGIGLLSDEKNDNIFRAFCLANRVMDDQSRGAWRGDDARPLVWRPFQLAFLLLCAESVSNDQSTDRSVMDLLWFPTGGGKTEAYLGLVAFTIFLRRIRNPGDPAGHVDVMMRYTLRLLTVQQFQRAAAMICAADILRRDNEQLLGKVPISIGLFVGQGATPNRLFSDLATVVTAETALREERAGKTPASTPRLLLNCPLCGMELAPDDYQVHKQPDAMTVTCRNAAACPSGGVPLPIHTVDDEIYRVRPSLLIGTVDKFAQLPRKEEVQFLFGLPQGQPPALIIQDELHLISGPLGTMTGLYETCIDWLCTRNGVRPKIIGSTATIGRAKEQVRALFDRDVMQFPPPAVDATDSFFAVQDTEENDRIYMGVSSSGRSAKFVLQATAAAFLILGTWLEEIEGEPLPDIDPYWTLLLYFNSLRELGGATVMLRDDVPRSMGFYANRLSCLKREPAGDAVELTSRIASTEIPKILRDLEFPLQGDPCEGAAVDYVMASNMISVGVDIPRLGLMVVNGQPKSTSEFIQATSRVGRRSPGLVLTVYNAARPRDASHFEHFKSYHQALYRRVEATSVTPWSSRARDRALHAVFVSMVRYLAPGMSGRFGARDFNPIGAEVAAVVNKIAERAKSSGLYQCSEAEVRQDLEAIMDRWSDRANRCKTAGKKLEYWMTKRPYGAESAPHLMRSAEEPFDDPDVWATPNSMREVEPTAYYFERTR